MKKSTFWNLGIFVIGVVNYIFESKKDIINLEVGEICIIIILLSVIIIIINEINTFIKENIAVKYQSIMHTNFKTNSFLNKFNASNININLIFKLHIIKFKKYKIYLTLI